MWSEGMEKRVRVKERTGNFIIFLSISTFSHISTACSSFLAVCSFQVCYRLYDRSLPSKHKPATVGTSIFSLTVSYSYHHMSWSGLGRSSIWLSSSPLSIFSYQLSIQILLGGLFIPGLLHLLDWCLLYKHKGATVDIIHFFHWENAFSGST